MRMLPALLLVTLLGSGGLAGQQGPAGPTVVYLFRHAERADDGTPDPPLSIAGQIRTQTLTRLLLDAGVDHIHTTDLRRTRETVRPLAEALGVEPQVYEPESLSTVAERILSTPGRHAVSGHSNTTPDLVALLGGDPGEPIDEPSEYDRLYILFLTPGQPTLTSLLRFGEPYVPGQDVGGRLLPMPDFAQDPPASLLVAENGGRSPH